MVVLLAALMHAIWNSLISQASEKGLFTLALHICSAVLAVPVLLVVGLPSELSYPYLLVSIFFTRLVHLHFDQGVCQERFWPCLYPDAGDGASVRDDHLPALAKRVIRHCFIFRIDIFDLRCFVSHERVPSQHHTIIKVGAN